MGVLEDVYLAHLVLEPVQLEGAAKNIDAQWQKDSTEDIGVAGSLFWFFGIFVLPLSAEPYALSCPMYECVACFQQRNELVVPRPASVGRGLLHRVAGSSIVRPQEGGAKASKGRRRRLRSP